LRKQDFIVGQLQKYLVKSQNFEEQIMQ